MRNAASASYSVFSTIPCLSVARKTLIFQCFQKYRYLTSAFNRPDFQKLIEDIENGEISTVIVKDMSRFGRDHIMVGYYTQYVFPDSDVRFIAIYDQVDSTSGIEDDITPFKNILNEMYAKD